MKTTGDIEAEIARTQAELQNVHGTATEVYARIVGYYRSVRNWNKGKREEFAARKMFSSTNPKISGYTSVLTPPAAHGELVHDAAFLEVYTRKTCPNCPPVKEFCSELGLPVRFIDADTDEGFRKASNANVRSCPTVIIYDAAEKEMKRAYSVPELKDCRFIPYTAEAVIA
ncbi:MAG: anaerobic ribonucleoside-triphosphate reductase [Treponema sp.]